jgi:integrase
MTQSRSPQRRQATTSGLTTERPFIRRDKDRHGNERVFVRRNGRSIRLRTAEGTAAFDREYADALARLAGYKKAPEVAAKVRAPDKHTVGWLAAKYFANGEFTSLDPTSQRIRRSIIEECLQELHNDFPLRDCPLTKVTPAKIKALLDTKVKAGLRGAANNRRKYLSAMFGWAVHERHMPFNPARDVRRVRYATDGFHGWTVEEVDRFQTRHPIGSKARLAMALLLFLGVRRSDLVRLGPKMVRETVEPDGQVARSVRFTVRKTRHVRATETEKPILPALWEIMQASQLGKETFLETEFGKPFTANGFGNWMRTRCNEAGLPECTAHGLRKASASLAAENGATVHQLMAIFDWVTPSQAEVYTRKADRKRLARSNT